MNINETFVTARFFYYQGLKRDFCVTPYEKWGNKF